MITTYAKVVGSFLFGLGAISLVSAYSFLGGVLHFSPLISLVFLTTGVMLLVSGFSGQWSQTRKTVLLSAGIYALLAVTGFLSSASSLQYSSEQLLYLSLGVSGLMFGLPEAYAFKR